MPHKKNTAVPAAYLILQKKDKVLLMRRKNTGYYDGWWALPAGHIEAGELPMQALIREAQEEIGISLELKNLSFAHSMYRTRHDETGDRADWFFAASVWKGDIINAEPDKCAEIRWFHFERIPKDIVHHDGDALRFFNKRVAYSEFSFDPQKQNPTTSHAV